MTGVKTGGDTSGLFYHEDNGFNASPSDTTAKVFGADQNIDSEDGSNNAVRVLKPNSRIPAEIIEQHFSGSWSAEFTFTNGWWLEHVIGSVSTTGTGPYTHTYSGEDVTSLQIIHGRPGESNETKLTGCVVAEAEISVDVQGNITVSLSGAYAESEEVSSATTQPTTDYSPLTFAQARIDRNGTTLNLVQSASITISNNIDLVDEIGSRVSVDFSPKLREVDLEYTQIAKGTDVKDQKERLYGGASTVQSEVTNTVPFTFVADNGQTGSSINKLTVNLTNGFLNELSISGLNDPESNIELDASNMMVDINADYENGDSTAK